MEGNNTNGSMARRAGVDFPDAPVTMLDMYMPWLGMVSRLVLEPLGFDIKVIVLLYMTASTLAKYATLVWSNFVGMLEDYCMPRVSVGSFDRMHIYLMDWIEKQPMSTRGTKLMVKSTRGSSRTAAGSKNDGAGYPPAQWPQLVNLKAWSAQNTPGYQVFYGVHYFRHNGYLFKLNQPEPDRFFTSGENSMTREQWTHLSCVGFTASPVKQLLADCQTAYHANRKQYTTMYRPAKREWRWKREDLWVLHAKRLSRSLETVDMDKEKRDRVLKDINTYLQPQRAEWYADRAIPYRRGYLFHGPPGTGKTTLSFAVAGAFGLDIHCLSLRDPQLTEDEVISLFNDLPSRCVMLLEDVDSAGLKRNDDSDDDSDQDRASDSEKEKLKGGKKKKKGKKSNISLSCLLNAIDGVGSQEGRLLIMTTNCPEKLDDALLRPGRVDMKVEFTNASTEQIRQMFARMFLPDASSGKILPSEGAAGARSQDESTTKTVVERASVSPTTENLHSTGDHEKGMENAVDEAANAFAAIVPADTFSPAEIQGCLLAMDDDYTPHEAVEEAKAWVETQLEARRVKAEKKNRRKKDKESADLGIIVA